MSTPEGSQDVEIVPDMAVAVQEKREMDLPSLFKLAEALVPTGFLPEAIRTPGQAVAIILAGRELGIGPMLALRSIGIIKGKVVLAADLQLAQFKKFGGKADFKELSEQKAILWLRHPNGDEHTETFTIEDAKRAGLVRAGGNWTTFPKAMLRSRAITAGLKSLGFEPTCGAYDPDEAMHFVADEAPKRQISGPVSSFNPSQCLVIALFSGNDDLRALSEGDIREATAKESQILLQRLQEKARSLGIPSPKPGNRFFVFWHKGGNLGINGEHRLIGEGLSSFPCFVACCDMRLSHSEEQPIGASGSSDRILQPKGSANVAEKRSETERSSRSSDSQRNPVLSPARIEATPEQKTKFLTMLAPVKQAALQYAIDRAWILPTEGLDAIPLSAVPTTQKQFQFIMDGIRQLMDGDQIPGAEVMDHDKDMEPEEREEFEIAKPDEAWRSLIVPFGKNKGETFGSLEKGQLWWWCVKWQPEDYIGKDGKTYPPKKSDLELRSILDEVRKQYQFTDTKKG